MVAEGIRRSCLIATVGLLGAASAQYFPPPVTGVRTLQSKFHPGVSVSYKRTCICETTPGVKSYSGYVNLPPDSLYDTKLPEDYNISYFYWFIESRKDPANAPLAIWLNGGPGASSLIGMLSENGPCFVNADSNSTSLNPWSWNNEVNMLYIDQPVQVGFSYDTPTNGTVDEVSGNISLADFSTGVPQANNTFFVGTFASDNVTHTANSTENGARALWHFAQVFFREFPAYKPNDDRVSLWAESYGGRYGPAYVAFFEEQNMKYGHNSSNTTKAIPIHLDTLGIVNGCVDLLSQAKSYPTFAYNNTYGIQAINETLYRQALNDLSKPGGCLDLITNCRALAAQLDQDDFGNSSAVNEACQQADTFCSLNVEGPYINYGGRGYYDIGHLNPDPFPPSYHIGYLNQHWVQAALGVPVNYSEISNAIYYAFSSTGDYPRGGFLEDLSYILDNGIKVAMMYGDRDYACNWLGGETVSLSVKYSASAQFRAAGYQGIQVNSTYVGGEVRQYGNLSFSRVFEAGHEVPAYQPETAYKIFRRAMFNRDIATGAIDTARHSNYSSRGPASSFAIIDPVPASPEPTCYIWAPGTCTDAQYLSLLDGSAIVMDYIVIGQQPNATVPGGTATPAGPGPALGTGTRTRSGLPARPRPRPLPRRLAASWGRSRAGEGRGHL
ncbi:MAG: hypothetical protein M1826_003943 [Phylliscum demangeonii]|nr:MAG: hypothetical protein M1826_003943 [Phylliscum demangeonii]